MRIHAAVALVALALLAGVSSAQPGIVGGWYTGDTSTSNSSVLILLESGTYVHIVGSDLTRTSTVRLDGYERGTYAFDPATSAFVVNTELDTDGERGLGAMSGIPGARAELAGDTLTFDIPGRGFLAFNRVAALDAVVGAWAAAQRPDWHAVVLLPDRSYYYYLAVNWGPHPTLPVVRHSRYDVSNGSVLFDDDYFWDVRLIALARIWVLFGNDVQSNLSRVGEPYAARPPWDGYTAVEYHHAGYQHYFVTASEGEIGKFDRGEIAGWARTGNSFSTATPWDLGLDSVCRFASRRFAKPTHFHTPFPEECAALQAHPDWQFEGWVFEIYPVIDRDGRCPEELGMFPLYRLYNGGRGGAVNHRLTTNENLRSVLLQRGYIAEGIGTGVIGCVPRSSASPLS